MKSFENKPAPAPRRNHPITAAAAFAGSLLAVYLVFEFCVFRLFLPHLPLRYHGYLSEPFLLLAQSSKKSLFPENYTVILGDSYAQGFGNWLIGVDKWKNADFGPQHVLHQAWDEDVVNMGKGGNGSLGTLVARPVHWFRGLNQALFCRLEAPRRILVFFYENDPNDNILEIESRFDPSYERRRILEPVYFRKFIEEVIVGEEPLGKKLRNYRWYDHLIFFKFMAGMASDIISGNTDTRYPLAFERGGQTPSAPGSINRILVGSKVLAAPDALQSPAMELTDEEIELAAYIFGESLKYLIETFPESEIFVVYIPSPLSVYRPAGERVHIQTYHERSDTYSADSVWMRSDQINQAVRDITQAQGLAFIDTRPALRKVAEKELLHGPLDWKHLNKRGYTVLAEAIVSGTG